ncbi:UNVERIFIED_CONTAM: hypothetical protein K2H54_001923 [Gekko kuhli]
MRLLLEACHRLPRGLLQYGKLAYATAESQPRRFFPGWDPPASASRITWEWGASSICGHSELTLCSTLRGLWLPRDPALMSSQEKQVGELSAVRQTLQADLETSIRRIADLQAALEEVQSSDDSDTERVCSAAASDGKRGMAPTSHSAAALLLRVHEAVREAREQVGHGQRVRELASMGAEILRMQSFAGCSCRTRVTD